MPVVFDTVPDRHPVPGTGFPVHRSQPVLAGDKHKLSYGRIDSFVIMTHSLKIYQTKVGFVNVGRSPVPAEFFRLIRAIFLKLLCLKYSENIFPIRNGNRCRRRNGADSMKWSTKVLSEQRRQR